MRAFITGAGQLQTTSGHQRYIEAQIHPRADTSGAIEDFPRPLSLGREFELEKQFISLGSRFTSCWRYRNQMAISHQLEHRVTLREGVVPVREQLLRGCSAVFVTHC